MTDLELTKLCAEAMGYAVLVGLGGMRIYRNGKVEEVSGNIVAHFDPLHDDAQCLALVKKFHIEISWNEDGVCTTNIFTAEPGRYIAYPVSTDLNRAVCLCVARMQLASPAA